MKTQIISFHCVLKNKLGMLISSTFNQDVLTQPQGIPEKGDLLQGLANGLQNLNKGEKRKIALSADQAYGFYDPALSLELSKKEISHGSRLQIGSQVQAQGKDGEIRLYRVTQVRGDRVHLDANHPLAGQDLIFEIEATDARDATPEDLLDLEEPSTSERLLH